MVSGDGGDGGDSGDSGDGGDGDGDGDVVAVVVVGTKGYGCTQLIPRASVDPDRGIAWQCGRQPVVRRKSEWVRQNIR